MNVQSTNAHLCKELCLHCMFTCVSVCGFIFASVHSLCILVCDCWQVCACVCLYACVSLYARVCVCVCVCMCVCVHMHVSPYLHGLCGGLADKGLLAGVHHCHVDHRAGLPVAARHHQITTSYGGGERSRSNACTAGSSGYNQRRREGDGEGIFLVALLA